MPEVSTYTKKSTYSGFLSGFSVHGPLVRSFCPRTKSRLILWLSLREKIKERSEWHTAWHISLMTRQQKCSKHFETKTWWGSDLFLSKFLQHVICWFDVLVINYIHWDWISPFNCSYGYAVLVLVQALGNQINLFVSCILIPMGSIRPFSDLFTACLSALLTDFFPLTANILLNPKQKWSFFYLLLLSTSTVSFTRNLHKTP